LKVGEVTTPDDPPPGSGPVLPPVHYRPEEGKQRERGDSPQHEAVNQEVPSPSDISRAPLDHVIEIQKEQEDKKRFLKNVHNTMIELQKTSINAVNISINEIMLIRLNKLIEIISINLNYLNKHEKLAQQLEDVFLEKLSEVLKSGRSAD
jgi:hypothetical protein